MTEALQQEIRTLKNLFESERDPEGRVFAPLADAYRRAGELQQAVQLLNEGLARHPEFVPGHVVAAQLYVEQGLAQEAAIAARHALELDAENVNALRSLLHVLQEGGDREADDVRARLAELDPDFTMEAAVAPATAPPPLPEVAETAAVDESLVDLEAPTVERPAVSVGDEAPTLAETESVPAVLPDFGSASQDPDDGLDLGDAAFDVAPEPGPDLASEEPLVDLDALAPVSDEAEVEEGSAAEPALEPDMELPTEEPVVDLDSLAPVSSEVEVEDLVAAPEPRPAGPDMELPTEEPVVDLEDLAPLEAETVEEPVGLADLAPEPEQQDAVSLADLAPDVGEEALALADLAPDESAEEPVMELADLAPDETEAEDATVMDLAALAPDEPVEVEEPVALADLAPDETEDEDATVVDLAALAPDEPVEAEEEPVALADLAPDAEDEEPVALADLAPDAEDEPVALSDLAPSKPDEGPVMELSELAPATEEEDEAVVMDLDALAPGEPSEAEEEPVAMGDLAPEADTEVTMVDLVDQTPDEPDEVVIDVDALGPAVAESDAPTDASADAGAAAQAMDEEADAADDDGPGEPVYTRTLAELYVKQGAIGQALEVYRHLSELDPANAELTQRIEELESGGGLEEGAEESAIAGEAPSEEEREDEVDTLARELAENGEGAHDDVESPFTMDESVGDEGAEEAEAGPTIGDYFGGLLGWQRVDRS